MVDLKLVKEFEEVISKHEFNCFKDKIMLSIDYGTVIVKLYREDEFITLSEFEDIKNKKDAAELKIEELEIKIDALNKTIEELEDELTFG